MNVKIIKPDSTLYDGPTTLIQLPGTCGLFELLENHAPITHKSGYTSNAVYIGGIAGYHGDLER